MMSEKLNGVIQLVKENQKFIRDQYKQFWGEDMDEYLNKYLHDLSHVKTFLCRYKARHIADVYYPLRIGNWYWDEESTKIESSHDLFHESNYVLIKGDAGSGKSTLMKYIVYDTIKNKSSIPILISLREVKKENSITRLVLKEITDNKVAQNENIAKKMMIEGSFTFLFDGYDEVLSIIKNDVLSDIEKFTKVYNNNKYVITSRHNSNIGSISFFNDYVIMPLEMNEIKEFVNLNVKEEIAKNIIKSLKYSVNSNVGVSLDNILILSIYILTHQSFGSAPMIASGLYTRIIEALFTEHDSLTKAGFTREYISRLSRYEIEKILQVFSFITYFQEQFEFNFSQINSWFDTIKESSNIMEFVNIDLIDDLVEALSLWLVDEGEYTFIHRSIQEYYCALYISDFRYDKKSEFYEKILEMYFNCQRTEMNNLLTILEEIDHDYYVECFLVPLYKLQLSNLESDDSFEQLDNFYNYIIEEFDFEKESSTRESITYGRSDRILNFYSPLFEGTLTSESAWNIVKSIKSKDYVISQESEKIFCNSFDNGKKYTYTQNKIKEMLPYLVEGKFMEYTNNVIKQYKNEIHRLNSLLEKSNLEVEEYLDLF